MLRILFAAHPELLTPVLQIIHRVIAWFLLKQAGVKRTAADTGAVTLIQRLGSAANLNIQLHCLVLDGVYRRAEGEPDFQATRAPTRAELEGILEKIVARLMKMLTRLDYLVAEEGVSYLADLDRGALWRRPANGCFLSNFGQGASVSRRPIAEVPCYVSL